MHEPHAPPFNKMLLKKTNSVLISLLFPLGIVEEK